MRLQRFALVIMLTCLCTSLAGCGWQAVATTAPAPGLAANAAAPVNGGAANTDAEHVAPASATPKQQATDVHATDKPLVTSGAAISYDELTADVRELAARYPRVVAVKSIGKSVDGRELWAIHVGTGAQTVCINAAHHAREYMTTNLTLAQAEAYASAYVEGGEVDGTSVRELLDHVSLWFIPMVNPDGVTLAQSKPGDPIRQEVGQLVGPNFDFATWKANIRGVDLNRQYPYGWDRVQDDPGKPAPWNYKGPRPLSEPESQALYQFTLDANCSAVVAYHTAGDAIYWYDGQQGAALTRDEGLAKELAGLTGYTLVGRGASEVSTAGYKDWFVGKLGRPGFTIEVGNAVTNHPVAASEWTSIWRENENVPALLAKALLK